MTSIKNKMCILFFVFVVHATQIFCSVPMKVYYQSILKEKGQLVTGTRKMKFEIYKQPTGGTAVWSSGDVNIEVKNGVFRYTLDFTNSNIDFANGPYYLQVTIEGTVLSPREEIVSTIYAIQAKTVEDGSITPQKVVKGSKYEIIVSSAEYAKKVNWNDIEGIPAGFADGVDDVTPGFDSIGSYHIIDSTITSADIKDGAITTTKIADGAVTDVKIQSISPTKISAGDLPSNVSATAIKAGEYLNDVKVSSAVYADVAGSLAGGVPGDNLGNHIATQDLDMSNNDIINVNKLQVNDVILATGTYGSGWTEPNLGAGTRFLWYPRKAAIRAGEVNGQQWNDSQIGNGSVAFGGSNTASGRYSVVSGGSDNVASGDWSAVSSGWYNTSSGGASVVSGGRNNTASGAYSVVSGGLYNITSGWCSVVSGGLNNQATGEYDWVGGRYGILTGSRTFAWVNSDSPVTISKSDAFIIYGSTVGIGTTSPSPGVILHVKGNVVVEGVMDIANILRCYNGFFIQNYGGGWYMNDTTWLRSYNNKGIVTGNTICARNFMDYDDNLYIIDPSGNSSFYGNVSIGTTNPVTKLTVVGLQSGTGSSLVYNTSNGGIYYQSSSIRYKENIQPFIDDFSKVLKLQPKTFNYKETKQKDIGYIAEELDEIGLKSLVGYDKDGLPETIHYEKITVYLVEVVKLQQKEIEQLKKEIEQLKSSR